MSLSDAIALVDQLPYRLGTNQYWQRLHEAKDKNEQPIEVNCFGLPRHKYKILGTRSVRTFNEQLGAEGVWQLSDMVEYKDVCPICGRLMLVRAIKGTTWLACCSEKCYKKIEELRQQVKRDKAVA